MKQVTSMSRLTNQLERMFRALNADFFGGALEMPVITVTPTARAYAHYTPWTPWTAKEEHKREINISSAYLDRPLEYICESLLHEAAHMYNDTVLGVNDVSRERMYHNRLFKQTAEDHGLICSKTDKYGWSDTSSVLSDELLDWVLLHDEFREIELYRTAPGLSLAGLGVHAGEGCVYTGCAVKGNSHHRRYVCPCCGMIARTTRAAKLICGDCMTLLIET